MDPMDHNAWRPHFLAATADESGSSGAGGGSGRSRGRGRDRSGDDHDDHEGQQSPSQKASQKASEGTQRRRKRRTKATPGNAGNWLVRGTVLRQRLAQWFTWTRTTRLHMSLRELQAAAHTDGVSLSVTAIQRIESLVDPALANERSWIAWDYVLWLAAYSGQSIADLDRFLNSGDWRNVGSLTDAAPSAESLADRVRVRFLALSPERQRAVADFIEHERYLDELDLQASLGLRPLTSRTTQRTSQQQPTQQQPEPSDESDGIDEATQQVLGDLARGQEITREAMRQHEQQPGQHGQRGHDEDQPGQQQRHR